MKTAVLDTGVIISLIDRRDETKMANAKALYKILVEKNVRVVYSQRTKYELIEDPRIEARIKSGEINFRAREEFLQNHTMLPYYVGNETWGQCIGTWDNIGSLWGGGLKPSPDSIETEVTTHNRIQSYLKKQKDLKDQGILLDAVFSKCDYFIHENPKDFGKISDEFWREFKLKEINHLSMSAEELILLFTPYGSI